MNNIEKLDQLWSNVCKLDDCMDTYVLKDEIKKMYRKEKENLKWSTVYSITDGNADKALFEGPNVDCTAYIINHPELKGKCIIAPLY